MPEASASRRPLSSLRAWLIGAVVAGLAAGIATAISTAALNVGSAVNRLINDNGGGAPATPTGPDASPEVLPATDGVSVITSDGVYISADTNTGLGCGGTGYVYPPLSGVTDSTRPGTGPSHDGQTWELAPAAEFGAISAPPQLSFTVTGPASHAIILTRLTFHVLSRKPPVRGAWLNEEEQCGGGGQTFVYGAVDFSTPAPYWIAPHDLPSYEASSAIEFPYTVTATQPVIFLIGVQAQNCECTWQADLTWSDDGVSHTIALDDGGRPYLFTTVSGLNETVWTDENGWQTEAP